MNQAAIEVVLAILKLNHLYLMQLRDDIPDIAYPGHWGLFGGHVDPGETPTEAVQRELQEEISYLPSPIIFVASFPTPQLLRHVFTGSLTVDLNQLELGEGWDMGLWTLEQIKAGEGYSSRADDVRPLAPPHQTILLDLLGD